MFLAASVGMSFLRQPKTCFKTEIQLDSEIEKSLKFVQMDNSHHFEVLMITLMSNLVIRFKGATLEDELCFYVKPRVSEAQSLPCKRRKKNLQPLKHNANAFFPF